MDINIRLATLNDLSLIREMCIKTFSDTYLAFNSAEDMAAYMDDNFSEQKIWAGLADPDSNFILAYVDQMPAGYAMLKPGNKPRERLKTNAMEIVRLYAHKNFHGKGVGKALMKKCIEIAIDKKKKSIWLDVWQKNIQAIDFYKKFGFKIVDTYFFILGKDRQDDYIMELEIKS